MLGATPLPDLDLGAVRRPCVRLPWRVAQILVDDLDPADAAAYERTASYWLRDDDDARPSTLSYRVRGAKRERTLRKAGDAWRVAQDRGLVPDSWRDEPRRVFADQELISSCAGCGGMGATGYNYDDPCLDCHGKGDEMIRGSTRAPTSLAAMWMVADPQTVEAAEALAREAVRRLPNAPAVDRVQWGRVREGKARGTVPLVLSSPIWDRVRPQPWDWHAMKGPAFRGASWWKDAQVLTPATREMLCFDVGGAWVHRAAGVADSPFEPLLRLWQLGVLMEELLPDAIVLERACARTYIATWRSHVPLA